MNYRSKQKQLFGWMYKSQVDAFSEMRNIPKELQKTLAKKYIMAAVHIIGSSLAKTKKFLFKPQTGEMIEYEPIPFFRYRIKSQ